MLKAISINCTELVLVGFWVIPLDAASEISNEIFISEYNHKSYND